MADDSVQGGGVVDSGQESISSSASAKQKSASKVKVKSREQLIKQDKRFLENFRDEEKFLQRKSKFTEKIIEAQDRLTDLFDSINQKKEQEIGLLKRYGILSEQDEKKKRKQVENYVELLDEQNELTALGNSLTTEQRVRLQKVREEVAELRQQNVEQSKVQLQAIDKVRTENEKLTEEYDKQRKSIESNRDSEESRVNEIQRSIASVAGLEKEFNNLSATFGECSQESVTFGRNMQVVEAQMGLFASEARDLSAGSQELLVKGLQGYKDFISLQASLQAQLKDGEIDIQQYNQKLEEGAKVARKAMSSISSIVGQLGEDVQQAFQGMQTQISDVGDTAKKVGKRFEELQKFSQKLGSSGVPVFDDIANSLPEIAKGGKFAAAAIAGIAAATAAVAFDYFAAPLTVARDALIAVKQDTINTEMSILDIQNKAAFSRQRAEQSILEQRQSTFEQIAQLENEAKFAGEKALIAYNNQLAQQAIQFKAQAKLALAGKGLGKIGYTADQLNIIGVSAGEIEEAFKAMGNVTGQMETNMKGMPVQELASSMAVFSKRTGVSSDILSSINFALQQSEGLTAEAALNMQAGMEAVARNAGIADLAGYYGEVAEASKNMYSYGIKNASSLARQVAFAKSMGLNFSAIADAGKNMVLNYQDSIRAEMELSVMLGESVDLSEVRAAFAKGGDEGVIEGIKAMNRIGLDIGEMDMFQVDQLQKTFGIDLGSIKTIMSTTGKDIDQLTATDIKTGNQQFIEKTKIVQQNQEVETANLSAAQAIVDARLSGKIAETYLSSPEYQQVLAGQAVVAAKAAEMDLMISNALKLLPAYQDAQVRLAQLNIESQFNWLNILKVAGQGVLAFVSGLAALKFMGGMGGGGFLGGPGGGSRSFADRRNIIQQRQAGGGFRANAKGGLVALGVTAAIAGGAYLWNKFSSDEEDSSGMSTDEQKAYEEQQRTATESQQAMDKLLKGMNTSISTQTSTSKDLTESLKQLGMDTTQGPGIVGMSGMISEPSGVCSCASAIIDVLETQLEQMREQMKLDEEGWKNYDKEMSQSLRSDMGAQLKDSAIIGASTVGTIALENAVVQAFKTKAIGESFKTALSGPALLSSAKALGPSMVAGVAGSVLSTVGDYKKQEGMDKGDLKTYNQGRGLSTSGTALTAASWGMTGAAIGTAFGWWSLGIGTIVGGAIGAVAGTLYGLYENYWSDEAKAAAEQVRLQNVANDFAKIMAETDQKEYEITIQRLKEVELSKSIAQNEKVWRQSMLSQTIEMTRLLDLMAQKSLGTRDGKFKLPSGQEVKLGEYNKAEIIGATELGIAPELNKREKFVMDLVNLAQAGGGSIAKGAGTKYAGETLDGLTFAAAMEKAGISADELAQVKSKVRLQRIAQDKAQSLVAVNTPQQGTVTTTIPGTGPINIVPSTAPISNTQPTSINAPMGANVNAPPQRVIAIWPAEPLGLLTAVKTAIVALPKTKEGLLRVTDEAANSKLGKIDTNVKLMSDNTEAIKKLTEVMANIAAAEATTSGLLTTAGGKIEFNIDGKKVFSAMNDVVNRMTGMLPTTTGQ